MADLRTNSVPIPMGRRMRGGGKLKLRDLHVVQVRVWRGKHTKKCECPPCLKKKLLEFQRRVEEMEQARPPSDVSSTVPVRAHWRRQANHLAQSPALRAAVAEIVRSLFTRAKERA